METFLSSLALSVDTTIAQWYLSVIPLLLITILIVLNIIKTKSVLAEVKGTILSEHDLSLVKGAINHNMQIAVMVLVVSILFFLILFILTVPMIIQEKLIGIFVGANHLLFFGIWMVIIGLYNGRFEKKLRNLNVPSEDPAINESYQRWLRQWKEARWKLPD